MKFYDKHFCSMEVNQGFLGFVKYDRKEIFFNLTIKCKLARKKHKYSVIFLLRSKSFFSARFVFFLLNGPPIMKESCQTKTKLLFFF